MKDKAMKSYKTFASQHYSYDELLSLVAQSMNFISRKEYRPTHQNISPTVSDAHATTSARIYANQFSEIEPVNNQTTEFQKLFQLIKQSEEIIEPLRANDADLRDIDTLK